jgi:hypothetical protein
MYFVMLCGAAGPVPYLLAQVEQVSQLDCVSMFFTVVAKTGRVPSIASSRISSTNRNFFIYSVPRD